MTNDPHAIIIHAHNNQDSYANAVSIIQKIEAASKSGSVRDLTFTDLVPFISYKLLPDKNEEIRRMMIEAVKAEPDSNFRRKTLPEYLAKTNLSDLRFIFRVDITNDDINEISNFQYLVSAMKLLEEMVSGKRLFILVTYKRAKETDQGIKYTDDFYFRLSHYLYLISLHDARIPPTTPTDKQNEKYSTTDKRIINDFPCNFYNSFFIYGYDDNRNSEPKRLALKRLAINNEKYLSANISTSFCPLLEISAETKIIFSLSVEDAFGKNLNPANLKEDILSKKMASLFSVNSNKKAYREITTHVIKAICLKYLFEAQTSDPDGEKEKPEDRIREIFAGGSPYLDMSLLSFLMFCVYFFYLPDEDKTLFLEKYRAERIIKPINDMQDFSAGFLQLFDNTIRHSQSKSGFFSFRIHKKEKLEFLKDKYPEGINWEDCCYLEVCITDLYKPQGSDYEVPVSNIMKDSFIKLNTDRLENKYYKDGDEVKVSEFLETFRNAKLKDFFDPENNGNKNNSVTIDDWDKFYAIPINILYHYGLMQFSSIIKSYAGWFEVRSGTKPDWDASCYYSSTGKKGNGKDKYIPGTQYAIVIPLRLQSEQKITGFNLSENKINFHPVAKWKSIACDNVLQSFFSRPQEIEQLTLFPSNEKNPEIKAIRTEIAKKPKGKKRDTEDICIPFAGKLSEAFKNTDNNIFTFDLSQFTSYLSQPDFDHSQFDGDNTNLHYRELFLKGLFYYIYENEVLLSGKKDNKGLKIAIINCSSVELLQIVELFCSFYNRFARCDGMGSVEIYLAHIDGCDDFLISGANLKEAIAVSEILSSSKGNVSFLHSVLEQKIWNRFPDAHDDPKDDSKKEFVPYSLAIKVDPGQDETIFERGVATTLRTNIQSENFGCKIEHSHVRIGSKIHVTENFFEAQELFQVPRYISGFAEIISKMIVEGLVEHSVFQANGSLVLIGYQTYSELLIISIKKKLKNRLKNITIDYAIFEDVPGLPEPRLRVNGARELKQTDKIAIIVPINSTLSTHNKIKSALDKKLKFVPGENQNVIANIAVLLIRDGKEGITEIEKTYWDDIQIDQRTIQTKEKLAIKPPVRYLVAVNSQWQDPLRCNLCYPIQYIEEKPLTETDKTSIIPKQTIGLITPNLTTHENGHTRRGITADWIRQICSGRAYRYGHIESSGNHFQYYFNPEVLFANITKKGNSDSEEINVSLSKWFADIKQNFPQAGPSDRIYNILVAPQNPNNAEWLNRVIEELFLDQPIVLRFDVHREYRDNIKTKLSHITALYENVKYSGKNAVINFHFIDSSIASGKTFVRAKNLIRSLFPEEAFHDENIKIKIFESIILLFSRCSEDTQRSYIDKGKFHSFLEFATPNIRGSKDACILCDLAAKCATLAERAATNEVAANWEKKEKKHRLQNGHQPKNESGTSAETADIVIFQERALKRLICAQEVYSKIDDLGYKKNDVNEVELCIWEMVGLNLSLKFLHFPGFYSRFSSEYNERKGRKQSPMKCERLLHYLQGRKSSSDLYKDEKDLDNDEKDFLAQAREKILTSYFTGEDHSEKSMDQLAQCHNDPGEYIEYLISFMKILSRTPITFRKSVLEASFGWTLKLLAGLLQKDQPFQAKNSDLRVIKVIKIIDHFIKNDTEYEKRTRKKKCELVIDLLKTLLGSLTKNGSNYMIRKENFSKIFEFYEKCMGGLYSEWGKDSTDFVLWYVNQVKRLIELNGDETKSLWLECLLLKSREWPEYIDSNRVEGRNLLWTDDRKKDLRDRLFIENTRIYYDGIADIVKNDLITTDVKTIAFLDPDKKQPAPYYLQNFCEIVKLNYTGDEYKNKVHIEQIIGMVRLYKLLLDDTKEKDIGKYYDKMREHIAKAAGLSGKENVHILGVRKVEDNLKNVKEFIKGKYEYLIKNGHGSSNATIAAFCEPRDSWLHYMIGEDNKAEQKDELEKVIRELISQFSPNPQPPSVNMEKIGDSILIKDKFLMAEIKPYPGSNDAREIEPIYLLLHFDKESKSDTAEENTDHGLGASTDLYLRSVRNILMFRNLFVKRLEKDFNSNLLRDYVNVREKKEYLEQSKAAGHTPNDRMKAVIKKITDGQTMDTASGYTFSALADQFCGQCYNGYISNGEITICDQKPENCPKKNSCYWNEPQDHSDLKKITESLTAVRFQMLAGEAKGINGVREAKIKQVDKEDEKKWNKKIRGTDYEVILLFTLLINNAMRYGLSEKIRYTEEKDEFPQARETDTMPIELDCDGKAVIISNPIADVNEEEAKKIIEKMNGCVSSFPSSNKSVSLWVINEYFKRLKIKDELCKICQISYQGGPENIEEFNQSIEKIIRNNILGFQITDDNELDSNRKKISIIIKIVDD